MSKKQYTPSRTGKQAIPVPKGVTVTIDGTTVSVKGPKGALSREFYDVTISRVEDKIVVAELGQDKRHKAMHGLCRALINNMVIGVSAGFTKQLEIRGVGYRMEQIGAAIKLSVGFSHVVMFPLPPAVTAKLDGLTKLTLTSIDKQLVGQVAAQIRAIRPPEPYKGKGIRYVGEHVRRKAGKAAGK